MSLLIDMIRGILGLGAGAPKDDFAGLDPTDLEAYWQVHNELDKVERAGGDMKAVYSRFGLRNESHWEMVQATFVRKYGDTPEFSLAVSTANFKDQLKDLSNPNDDGFGYRMPEEYLTPVEGVTLDKLALAKVRHEMQGDAGLASMGLDAGKFGRIEAGWGARMGGNADPTASGMLNSLYFTYLQQVRAVLNRPAG